MAGTTWPSLVAGQKAKASDVENKFDWIEGNIVPMTGGNQTTGVYDIGSSTYKFRDGYFSGSIAASEINLSGSTLLRAYISADTSLTITGKLVTFNTTTFDRLGEWTDGASRFYPQKSGYYQVYSNVTIDVSASAEIDMELRVDGSVTSHVDFLNPGDPFDISTVQIRDIIYMSIGSYLEVYINGAGSALDNIVGTTTGVITYITVKRAL